MSASRPAANAWCAWKTAASSRISRAPMHVLFLAPDTSVYNVRFVDGLVRAGARVSAIGHAEFAQLRPELKAQLAHYARAKSLLDEAELMKLARDIHAGSAIEIVET